MKFHTTIVGLIALFSASYSFSMEQTQEQIYEQQEQTPHEQTEEEIVDRREKERKIQEERAKIQANVKKQLSAERVALMNKHMFDPKLNPPAE